MHKDYQRDCQRVTAELQQLDIDTSKKIAELEMSLQQESNHKLQLQDELHYCQTQLQQAEFQSKEAQHCADSKLQRARSEFTTVKGGLESELARLR